jgi:tetratricopeptide (TPR) repeat protein
MASNVSAETYQSLDLGVAEISGRRFTVDYATTETGSKALDHSIRSLEELAKRRPSSAGFRHNLATLLLVRAMARAVMVPRATAAYKQLMLVSDARASLWRSNELFKAVVSQHPESPRFRSTLALSDFGIGVFYSFATGYPAALRAYRDAEEIQQALVREYPRASAYRRDLWQTRESIADLLATASGRGNLIDAIQNAIATAEQSVAEVPNDPESRRILRQAYSDGLDLLRTQMGQSVSSEKKFLTAFELYAELKEKQAALRRAERASSRHRSESSEAFPDLNYRQDFSFPCDTPYLDADGLGALKKLVDHTAPGARSELTKTFVDLATAKRRRGAKTYRMAASAVCWWAGTQEATIKLLESYAQEMGDDPQFTIALARAADSAKNKREISHLDGVALLSSLFDLLEDPDIDPDDASQIVGAIQRLDPDAQAGARRWEQLVTDPEAAVRRLAVGGLPKLQRLVPALEKSLTDSDAGLRIAATRRLWEIERRPEKVVPVLVACLGENVAANRMAAVSTLALVGPDARDAIPALKQLAVNSSGQMRVAVVAALWRIGRDASGVKSIATEFKARGAIKENDDNRAFCVAVSRMCCEIGPDARDARGVLGEALSASVSYDDCAYEILRALRRIDSTGALPGGTTLAPFEHLVAEALDKRVERGDQGVQPWYERALVCLAKEDQAAFQATCAEIVRRFGRDNDPATAYDTAWTCALAPHALPDLTPAATILEKALKHDPRSSLLLATLGAVHYRADRFDEAVRRMEEANQVAQEEDFGASWRIYAKFFLAMAHFRLGHEPEARTYLSDACNDTHRALDLPPAELDWSHRLTLAILRDEAETLISPGIDSLYREGAEKLSGQAAEKLNGESWVDRRFLLQLDRSRRRLIHRLRFAFLRSVGE